MSQFEALGEKEDYNEVCTTRAGITVASLPIKMVMLSLLLSRLQVIDGVMRQLLSRDLMYDPVQQVCGKFPEWLAVHRWVRCLGSMLPW